MDPTKPEFSQTTNNYHEYGQYYQPVAQGEWRGRLLRPYDKGDKTRKVLLIGFGVIVLGVVICFGITVGIFVRTNRGYRLDGQDNPPPAAPGILATDISRTDANIIILPLVMAFVVTSCQELIGLIHTFGLRETLRREGRLQFNTNLRLFQHCRTSMPNAWYTNALYVICASLAYSAVSRIFIFSAGDFGPVSIDGIQVNGSALAALTFGLGIQCIITGWSYVTAGHRALTWSSDPMDNALALLHTGLVRQDGRSMLSYSKTNQAIRGPMAQRPTDRQLALARSRPAVKVVLYCSWGAFLIATVFAIAWQTNRKAQKGPQLKANFFTKGPSRVVKLYSRDILPWAQELIAILFVLSIQLILTFTLHCVEIIINAARDERSWRHATDKKGVRFGMSALISAFTNWMTVTLFIAKSALHWAFGETFFASRTYDAADEVRSYLFVFIWARGLWLLSGLTFLMAIIITAIAYRRPRGFQPVAYGHYQTLNDLIDDWGNDGDSLFWGDKTYHPGNQPGSWQNFRHAGTAADSRGVGPIDPNAQYL